MTIITVPTKMKRGFNPPRSIEARMQVTVHIDTEVLDPEVARRKANVWLLETIGNLLGAENAELILGEPLRWRYDVILGLPNLDHPGAGDLFRVGMIEVNAVDGEILNQQELAEELNKNAAAALR